MSQSKRRFVQLTLDDSIVILKRSHISIHPIETIDRFPVEIWIMIVKRCNLITLYRLCQVSHSLYNIITDYKNGVFHRMEEDLRRRRIDATSKQLDQSWATHWASLHQKLRLYSVEALARDFNLDLIITVSGGGCDSDIKEHYNISFTDFLKRPTSVDQFVMICHRLYNKRVHVLGPTLPEFKLFRPDLDTAKFNHCHYSHGFGPTAHNDFELFQVWYDLDDSDDSDMMADTRKEFIERTIWRVVITTINEINDRGYRFGFNSRGYDTDVDIFGYLEYRNDDGDNSPHYLDVTTLSQVTLRKIADKLVEASERIK